jgi:hypothetical protein
MYPLHHLLFISRFNDPQMGKDDAVNKDKSALDLMQLFSGFFVDECGIKISLFMSLEYAFERS